MWAALIKYRAWGGLALLLAVAAPCLKKLFDSNHVSGSLNVQAA